MSDAANPQTDGQTPVDDIFDTTGFILDYIAHWKWVIISVVAFIIGAYFLIATIVPSYQVTSTVYLNSEDAQAKTDAFSLTANNPFFMMKDKMDETELEIIRSRNMILKVVDSLGMAYEYWEVGALRDKPIYQQEAVSAKLDSVSLVNLTAPIQIEVKSAGRDTYDIEAKTSFNKVKETKSFDNVKLPFTFELSQGSVTLTRQQHVSDFDYSERIVVTNPRKIADAISKAIDVAFTEKASSVLHITLPTVSPQQGVDFVDALIEFYNQQIIEDKNRSAIQTEAFILDRLVMINDELHDVEQRLQEYRQAHNISDLTVQVTSSFATKQTTEGQLADVEAQEMVISSIESVIAQADVYTAIPSVTTDQSLNQIIEAYNKRVNQLNRMLETSTPDNPLVRTLKDELTRDKARILQNVASVKKGMQARRANIAAIDSRSNSQLSSLPPIDKGLQEIFREQQVKVNIYTFLLQKREEIALQKTLATPTARFIDNPVVDVDVPISPRRMIIYFVALLLGAIVPAVVIYIRRILFPVYKDQEELQRLTNVPIIGEISADRSKDHSPIVVGANVSTAIAELFRLLRNNIGFTKNGAEKKVILVTSSISGEGKTFVTSNLAMTYALTGKRVVVLGLDIRRPMLAHQFGLTNQKGITTYLSGQTDDLDSLIHQSEVCEDLYILPAGPVPPNPNELLLSPNMTRMMEKLRSEFDYVLLDTAPIGAISDSFLIIPHSDVQLYVQRASYSTKSGLKVLHQAVRDNRLPDAYIVLNGVDMNSGAYRYRKYGHYYTDNHKYGYGYVSKNKK